MQRIWLAMMTAVLALPGLAMAQTAKSEVGDPAEGLVIARTWCASCHVVEPNPDRAVVGSVPTFSEIAGRPTVTADALRAFLAEPHGRMPPLTLSRTTIENTVAYIMSLQGK